MDFDITSISAIVAAAGVIVGVAFTVLELKHLVKQRRTDLVTRLSYDISTNREFLGALVDTYEVEFKDYDDFVNRYGKPISRNQVSMSFMMMGNFYEQIGVLLRNGLIDASLVSQLFPVSALWEKMKPLAEGMRKEYHQPDLFEWFEYLYDEMKKTQQQPWKGRVSKNSGC
jgi:hypothetical protein